MSEQEPTYQANLIEIPLRDLLLVLPYKGDHYDVRRGLGGIWVEPADEGCLIVAANGHVMGVLQSKGRVDGPRLLNIPPAFENWLNDDDRLDLCDCLELVVRTELSRAVVVHANKDEEFVVAGSALLDPKLFPTWRAALPPIDQLAEGINAAIASRYLTLRSDLLIGSGMRWWHDTRKPDAVHVARYLNEPRLTVFVMPVKQDEELPDWPAWMPRTAPAEAA